MNPAISLAMWRFGVFPTAGLARYIQLDTSCGRVLLVYSPACAIATLSGGDSNRVRDCPACHVEWRQFRIQYASLSLQLFHNTDDLWVFLIAPMVGAEIAERLLQALQRRRQELTHRLCGTLPDGRPLGTAAKPVRFRMQRLR
jgi:glycerol uptake facilitator-like aquaporin